MPKTRVSIMLTAPQAWALAQMTKRFGWDDAVRLLMPMTAGASATTC